MAAPSTHMPLANRINRIEVSATMAVVAEAEKLRAGGADLVDFGAGEPHFATPQFIKDAAIAAIQRDFTKYTAVAGTAELRDAIVKRHATDFGSNYSRDEAIATTGGKQAIFNAVQVLIDHGDEVILPVPYWVSFKDIIEYAGGVPVYVHMDESQGFSLTVRMVEQALTPRTKMIVLNSPSNPSGAVVSSDELRAIVDLARQRNIWVMSDECYVYLNYAGAPFSVGSLTEAKDRTVIVGSLSKTYAMTGWRLGYALAPKAIVSAINKIQGQSTSNPTSIVQKAAVAATTGPQQCIQDMKADYVRLRDRMVQGLRAIPGIQCQMPEGAFYAYPNVSGVFGRSGVSCGADVAGRLLREAGVVTVPGEAFGTKEHIRLSYATSMDAVNKGLERMQKWFGAL
jgi:aspartate aminotransferase